MQPLRREKMRQILCTRTKLGLMWTSNNEERCNCVYKVIIIIKTYRDYQDKRKTFSYMVNFRRKNINKTQIQYSLHEGSNDNVLVVVSWVRVMINKMARGNSSQLTDCIDLWPRQFNSYVMFLGG